MTDIRKRESIARTKRDEDGSIREVARRLESVGAMSIAEMVMRRRMVSRDKLFGRTRFKRVAMAQRELWALLFGTLAPISVGELGYLVDRDASSVVRGLRLREQEAKAEIAPEHEAA